jgi:prepilin-type N-terminal cleavage/methylation domain-containing protein
MNEKNNRSNVKGFTLIELLIVIAIIAIIAAVAFVALDPLTRFRDARDSSRWGDATAILSAIKVDQVDNGGSYITAVANMTASTTYMIGTDSTGCDDYNGDCDWNVGGDTNCVNLQGLVDEGYLGTVPISPTGSSTWTAGHTGYTVSVTSSILTVRSCESENSTDISVSR